MTGRRCTLAVECEWVRIDPRGLGDKLYLGVWDGMTGEGPMKANEG